MIGINQQIDTTSGGNQGVGFAVPVDLFERSVEQLREDGEVEYAYIGVGTKPLFPQLAEELDVDADAGAIVEEVSTDSPAEEAGIEPGDQQIDFQAIPYTTWAATSSSRSTARRSSPRRICRGSSRAGAGPGGHARDHPGRRGRWRT